MKLLTRLIKREKGSLAIVLAIMLPLLFSCCAMIFDGSRVLMKRARMADALNEAALAIATAATDTPEDDEVKDLKKLLNAYIHAYLPNDALVSSDVRVSMITDPETEIKIPVFDIVAKINVETLLPFTSMPAFDPNLELSNLGRVAKGFPDQGIPSDFVFVVDFSGSMGFNDSAEPGKSRIQLLKEVVKDITTKSLKNFPESTFALVPFDVGVPVRYTGVNSAGLTYNEAGGPLIGCSVLIVPHADNPATPEFDGTNIDFVFWADMNSRYMPKLNNNLTLSTYTSALIEGRMNYYTYYAIPSIRKVKNLSNFNFQNLIRMGWCKDLGKDTFNNLIYDCGMEADEDPNTRSLNKFNDEKAQFIISREGRSAQTVFESNLNGLLALTTMDAEATVEGMFDESNIINFPILHKIGSYNGTMCRSAPTQGVASNGMAEASQNAYLIEPTSDLNVLEEFQRMQPLGGTSSSSGLLRAVPEMLKGNSPRKVMIIISDGDDNADDVLDELHLKHNVCEKIRQGVKSRTDAEEVEIYFISVVDDAPGKERQSYWEKNCTGEGKSFIATNYNDIMEKLVAIIGKPEETGFFIN